MNKPVDSQLIGLRCEHCGRSHSASLGWLKAHDALDCDCGQPIFVRPNDLVDAVKRADACGRRHARQMVRPLAAEGALN